MRELADDDDSEQDRTSRWCLRRQMRRSTGISGTLRVSVIRMDLAAMQVGGSESKEQAVVQLELRFKRNRETTQSWIRRVCKVAGCSVLLILLSARGIE